MRKVTYIYFEKNNGETGNVIKVVKMPKENCHYCNPKEYRRTLSELNTTERRLYNEYIQQEEEEKLEGLAHCHCGGPGGLE